MTVQRVGSGMAAGAAGLYVLVLLAAIYRERGLEGSAVFSDTLMDSYVIPIVIVTTIATMVGELMVLVPGKKGKLDVYLSAVGFAATALMFYAFHVLTGPRETPEYWPALAGIPTFVMATIVSVRLGSTPQKSLEDSSRRNANHIAPPNWCRWPPAWRARY